MQHSIKSKFYMFKKIFKIISISIGVLVGILLIAYVIIYFDIRYRANKKYDINAEAIEVNYDSASLALGKRLVNTRACTECHGKDLGGATLVDDGVIGTFASKNITKGKGGLPSDFTISDWVLAMKHGVKRDGRPLYLMPSHELSQLTEKDMAAIIAYCSQVPNVDREPREFKIGPLGYVLSGLGLIPLLPAEFTDHQIHFAKEIKREISAAYGKYLSTICINCHGANLKGGDSPVPGGKYVADITSTGNPGKWSHEEFITALHTGVTPEGKVLKPEEMPWSITKSFTPDELTALHLYLQSIK
jgi:mono/diheme cytochrome c family protein